MGTNFQAEAIRNSADVIAGLLDDMAPFNELKNHWPDAGHFPLAQWLERVVDDRRNGIVAHGENLKVIFQKMAADLRSIADVFENTDGDNAAKITDILKDLESDITKAVNTHAENTEAQQHNFTHGDKDPKENRNDGDGYDDVLGPGGTTDTKDDGNGEEGGEESGGDDSGDDDDGDDDDDDDDSTNNGSTNYRNYGNKLGA